LFFSTEGYVVLIPLFEFEQKLKFYNKKYKNPPLASEFPPLQRGIKGDLRSSK